MFRDESGSTAPDIVPTTAVSPGRPLAVLFTPRSGEETRQEIGAPGRADGAHRGLEAGGAVEKRVPAATRGNERAAASHGAGSLVPEPAVTALPAEYLGPGLRRGDPGQRLPRDHLPCRRCFRPASWWGWDRGKKGGRVLGGLETRMDAVLPGHIETITRLSERTASLADTAAMHTERTGRRWTRWRENPEHLRPDVFVVRGPAWHEDAASLGEDEAGAEAESAARPLGEAQAVFKGFRRALRGMAGGEPRSDRRSPN